MTRRDPCLLQLKHGALLVLTLIFAVTAGMLINIYAMLMIKMSHESCDEVSRRTATAAGEREREKYRAISNFMQPEKEPINH